MIKRRIATAMRRMCVALNHELTLSISSFIRDVHCSTGSIPVPNNNKPSVQYQTVNVLNDAAATNYWLILNTV